MATEFPFAMAEALRRYGRLAERVERATHGDTRIEASEALAGARGVLEPQERAIVDMVAIRGRTVAWVAQQTARPVLALEASLFTACRKLVEHFESVGGGGG